VSASIRFGPAFCEASGPRSVRRSGNDDELIGLATGAALKVATGHCLAIFLRGGFPVNILNPVKVVPEMCRICCATAGMSGRRELLLRSIGYKLGRTDNHEPV
jgi:adenosine/AMP kinase